MFFDLEKTCRTMSYGGRVFCDGYELKFVSECVTGPNGYAITRSASLPPFVHRGHVIVIFGDDDGRQMTVDYKIDFEKQTQEPDCEP